MPMNVDVRQHQMQNTKTYLSTSLEKLCVMAITVLHYSFHFKQCDYFSTEYCFMFSSGAFTELLFFALVNFCPCLLIFMISVFLLFVPLECLGVSTKPDHLFYISYLFTNNITRFTPNTLNNGAHLLKIRN